MARTQSRRPMPENPHEPFPVPASGKWSAQFSIAVTQHGSSETWTGGRIGKHITSIPASALGTFRPATMATTASPITPEDQRLRLRKSGCFSRVLRKPNAFASGRLLPHWVRSFTPAPGGILAWKNRVVVRWANCRKSYRNTLGTSTWPAVILRLGTLRFSATSRPRTG